MLARKLRVNYQRHRNANDTNSIKIILVGKYDTNNSHFQKEGFSELRRNLETHFKIIINGMEYTPDLDLKQQFPYLILISLFYSFSIFNSLLLVVSRNTQILHLSKDLVFFVSL